MPRDEAHKLDVAAMLRMTEYLIKAAQNLRLGRAEHLFRDAFDAVALGSPAGATLDGVTDPASSTPITESLSRQ